jgi:hypothetical protein
MLTVNNFQPTVKRNSNNDGFAEILREAFEYFSENNVQMVSGFSEILGEDALFSEYVSRMTTGLTADESEQLEQILENARLTMLQESTVSQVTPLVGLSMPTVRKMWVKTALKNAIPTETAKVPSFTISWMEPYMRDQDGTKHPLPQSLRGMNSLAEKPPLTDEFIAVPADNQDLLALSGASVVNHDAIDPILFIDQVKMENASGTVETVKADLKLSIESGFYGQVKASDGTTDQLFGTIDLESGIFSVASVKGAVKEFNFKGWLTQENNTRTQSVSFDIRRKDIRIGTGSHLNAEMPIEWLQDTLALYNIDATVEVVDIMSNVVAQKLDQEIITFFEDSFKQSGSPFVGKFDVKPAAGFAGSPTEWRHELRTTIEWWATKLKSYTLFTQGYFVIYGNPLDINLMPDINWQFKSVQGERGGVNVNYDFGVMTANNIYQVVASENVPQGKLTMFFVPNVDNYMTYKYYPYTFNIEKGYISPQNMNVPSIMMTKRHTIEELIPMQVQIEILHNDGSLISNYAL